MYSGFSTKRLPAPELKFFHLFYPIKVFQMNIICYSREKKKSLFHNKRLVLNVISVAGVHGTRKWGKHRRFKRLVYLTSEKSLDNFLR